MMTFQSYRLQSWLSEYLRSWEVYKDTFSLHEDLGPHICIKDQLKLAICLGVTHAFLELQKLKNLVDMTESELLFCSWSLQ